MSTHHSYACLKFLFLFSLFGSLASASIETGIVVHAAEYGVGKFHRHDNRLHPYSSDSAWGPFVLPLNAPEVTPLVVPQTDGSYSIFFSTLEELLLAAKKLSLDSGKKISLMNLNAHGIPGGTWFPKDETEKNSEACVDWRSGAAASDEDNYNDYYSAITMDDILDTRIVAKDLTREFQCTAGLTAWQEVNTKIPNLRDRFTDDFQLHFFSCTVGLGARGKAYTEGLAKLLLKTPQGSIQTALQFGLGDWSMPEGMGFWDYQNDAQLDKDNRDYVLNKKDRDQMQLGTIRTAQIQGKNLATSSLLSNIWFMFGRRDSRKLFFLSENIFADLPLAENSRAMIPATLRIPGTRVRALQKN